MTQWVKDLIGRDRCAIMPILSFPAAGLLGVKVRDLICDSGLQSEGMRLVAERIPSEASVSLMDLSVEAECFGATISFSDDEVPTVKGNLINDEAAADALQVPIVGSARSAIYIESIRRAAEIITDRPIFAGIIGPFSLAARLISVSEIMMDCYDEPDMVHTVLDKATDFLIEYAKAYKSSGAHGIIMAEPVAGLLSPTLEAEFSAPYVKKIVDAVQDEEFILIYHNCGDNVPHMLDSIISVGAAAYHFGNAVDMEDIIKRVPENIPVMGNIDPAGILRMGSVEDVGDAVVALLDKCSSYPNFVLSSGCDIPPLTPWDNIQAFFDAAKSYYGTN